MPFSMKPSAVFFLTLVFAARQRALAVNDWSVPCTQGNCSWDFPANSGASGSLNIWGPVNAISDITPATGWQITAGCDPSNSTQNVQLVCKDNSTDCNHLFQGDGAVNTIVRLPDSCGPMPFARVAQHQVLQPNLTTRANDSGAPVHQLTLDTDFTTAGPSQGGAIQFYIQGQNGPNNSATGVNNVNAARGLPFNESLSTNPAPVNFSGQKNLFSQNNSPTDSVSLDVGANVQASVGISALAAGTLNPFSITQFGVAFGLNGNFDANFSVVANTSGEITSGNVTLFQVGIPGFSIPDFLDIRPQFTLLGRIDANFGLQNVNAGIEVNYDLSGASFVFPPQDGSQTNGISPSTKHVTFSANPSVGATLDASAHLIPQISLGISALGGQASILLDLDASLDFNASVASAANPQPCVAGSADINVDVGMQGSFPGLFDVSVSQEIFEKDFPLFQQCFAGNTTNSTSSSSLASSQSATATNSSSQTSASSATATNSSSQTSASSATATNLSSQTGGSNTIATDSASQTSAPSTGVTATNSGPQTSASNITAATSTSQSNTAGAPTANPRRRYRVSRAVRHGARFGHFALPAN